MMNNLRNLVYSSGKMNSAASPVTDYLLKNASMKALMSRPVTYLNILQIHALFGFCTAKYFKATVNFHITRRSGTYRGEMGIPAAEPKLWLFRCLFRNVSFIGKFKHVRWTDIFPLHSIATSKYIFRIDSLFDILPPLHRLCRHDAREKPLSEFPYPMMM